MAFERHILDGDGARARTSRVHPLADNPAFDAWLQQSLADRHDGALAETLPGEWLDLIRGSC